MTPTIAERAEQVGLRFDVRGLRDFVLIDDTTGRTFDFQTTEALREFLAARERDNEPSAHRPRRPESVGKGAAKG